MTPKTLALALALAVAAVAGCSLRNGDLRRGAAEAVLERFGGGQVIEPKRVGLKVAILPRPQGDPAVNSALWAVAEEQAVPPETRRALTANGLKVGVITGALPAPVEAALAAPPPDKVEPAVFNQPDGVPTQVSLTGQTPTATILTTRDGVASGKDYQDASGWLRVTPTQAGATGVALRVVPEIHHGPVLHRFGAAPGDPGAMNAMQFTVKDGQQEETLRDLATTLTLQPGQVAVIGCDPDRRGSLGAFLLTQAETNSDRMLQKVVLVWATRNQADEPGSHPKPPTALFPVDPPDVASADKGHAPQSRTDSRPTP